MALWLRRVYKGFNAPEQDFNIIKIINNMRKITEHVTNAFENGRNCNEGNSSTHDRSMFLHGHEIAKFDDRGQLMITNAGWQTSTTKERLNGLSGVNIHQKDFQWFLNGEKWDGHWVEVSPEKLP